MKKFMNACIFSITALVSCGALAMRAPSAPDLSVEISNQTDGFIAIINPDGTSSQILAYKDLTVTIQPDESMILEDQKVTTIVSPQGRFHLYYFGVLEILYLQKEGKVISELQRPQNPILIFEKGKEMPTLRERDDQ